MCPEILPSYLVVQFAAFNFFFSLKMKEILSPKYFKQKKSQNAIWYGENMIGEVGFFSEQDFCGLHNQSRVPAGRGGKGKKMSKKNIELPSLRQNMGRRSKATNARLHNLGHAKESQKTWLEDVTDTDDEDYIPPIAAQHPPQESEAYGYICCNELEDSDSDSDDDASEFDEDEAAELQTEAEILLFSAILSEAQAIAIKLEFDAAELKPKRKRHYTKNSVRTKQHYTQKRKALAMTGQKFISAFFAKQETAPTTEATDASDTEPEEEMTEINIQEHLDNIFAPQSPSQESVSATLGEIVVSG